MAQKWVDFQAEVPNLMGGLPAPETGAAQEGIDRQAQRDHKIVLFFDLYTEIRYLGLSSIQNRPHDLNFIDLSFSESSLLPIHQY